MRKFVSILSVMLCILAAPAFAGDFSLQIDDSVTGGCKNPDVDYHNSCSSERVIQELDRHFRTGKPLKLNAVAAGFINGRANFASPRERQEIGQHLADLFMRKNLQFESQLLDFINVLDYTDRTFILKSVRKSLHR